MDRDGVEEALDYDDGPRSGRHGPMQIEEDQRLAKAGGNRYFGSCLSIARPAYAISSPAFARPAYAISSPAFVMDRDDNPPT